MTKITGSGSGSTQKCHGSATLLKSVSNLRYDHGFYVLELDGKAALHTVHAPSVLLTCTTERFIVFCLCNTLFYWVTAHCAPQSTHLHGVPRAQCLSPLWNWDPTHPLSRKRVNWHTRLRVRGWESPNSDDWRKTLSTLSTLKGGTSFYQHCSCQWVSPQCD
jgi:hypothetical protein